MPTPDEAMKMWCPFGRIAMIDSGWVEGGGFTMIGAPTFNRVISGDGSGRHATLGGCIADKCMMWRQIDPGIERSTARGFCGLGGKP